MELQPRISKDFIYYGRRIIARRGMVSGGEDVASYPQEQLNEEEVQAFRAHFGVDHFGCVDLWVSLLTRDFLPRKSTLYHLLWALMFMKLYSTEKVLSRLAGTTPKTYRKWTWLMLLATGKLRPYVVSSFIKINWREYTKKSLTFASFCSILLCAKNRFAGRIVSDLTMAASAKFLLMEQISKSAPQNHFGKDGSPSNLRRRGCGMRLHWPYNLAILYGPTAHFQLEDFQTSQFFALA